MGLVASFRLPLVIGKERERERERERGSEEKLTEMKKKISILR